VDQIHVLLRRLDAALGLLLEAVQDVDPSGELDRVDGAVSFTAQVLDHFQYVGRTEAGHHLGVLMPATGLGEVDGVSEYVLDVLRHRVQVALGRSDPFEGLAECLGHAGHYAHLDILMSIWGDDEAGGTRCSRGFPGGADRQNAKGVSWRRDLWPSRAVVPPTC